MKTLSSELCTHRWHQRPDCAWCPACGYRLDGLTTLCNAALGAMLVGPMRVRNIFTDEERVVRWIETTPDGCTLEFDGDEKPRLMESVELQAWQLLGHMVLNG